MFLGLPPAATTTTTAARFCLVFGIASFKTYKDAPGKKTKCRNQD
jgi:hypothetical protein